MKLLTASVTRVLVTPPPDVVTREIAYPIPYFDPDGEALALAFQVALEALADVECMSPREATFYAAGNARLALRRLRTLIPTRLWPAGVEL